jgi:diguanylate cyclase (GGDEF)-like protein
MDDEAPPVEGSVPSDEQNAGPAADGGSTDHIVALSERPNWYSGTTKALDDSVRNLLTQMAMAVGGMLVAFAVAEWVDANWLGNLGGQANYFTRGITFALFGALSIYITSARPIRSALNEQRKAVQSYEDVLEQRAVQHRLTARLQSALDMAESDFDAFDVVGRALDAMAGNPAELLLADSSRAHLRRVAVAVNLGGPDCKVETPWSCPAVRRGRTMVFPDSQQLDACPRLRERPGGACSALCVPVTVLGTPMGVIHTTSAPHEPPGSTVRNSLEAIAEQAGSRVGVLRAMATSELQATTDPLTGLLNRRSLEEHFTGMSERQDRYALAFCDLDHFKRLNDTHGHEAGDRALRSFARLLRSSVRETDVVCRYGGEEFVVIMPDTDAAGATAVMERLARSLREAVQKGEMPDLTVSVGITDWTSVAEPKEAIRQADGAMYMAKQAGRNRIHRAQDQDEPAPTDQVSSDSSG